MKDSRIVKRILLTQLPVYGLIFGLPTVNMLFDSAIIGTCFGVETLAAMGFATPLTLVVTAITEVLFSGSQVLCGKSLGRGDREGLNRVFNTALATCLCAGVVLTALFLCFPRTLALLLGADDALIAQAAEYIRGFGIGILFLIVSSCVMVFLLFEQRRKEAALITVLSMAVNLSGNILNALVLHGGLFYAGLFVSLGNLLSAVLALACLLKRSKLFRLSASDVNGKVCREMNKVGSAGGLETLWNAVRNCIVLQFAIRIGGTMGAAAVTIALTIVTAVSCFEYDANVNIGLSLAGIFAGQKDADALRRLAGSMTKINIVMYLAIYALLFFFARPLALLFGAEANQIALCVASVRIIGLYFLAEIVIIPTRCIFLSLNRSLAINVIAFLSGVVFTVLVANPLAGLWGMNGVNSIVWVDYLLTVASFFVLYIVKRRRFPRRLSDLCDVPPTLNLTPEHCLSMTLETVEDAVAASDRVVDFCKARGYNDQKAFACGLCIEEMAVDTIRNRFSRAESIVNLFLSYESGHFRFVLRDDCAYFDPGEWLELCQPADYGRSIGIRLTYALANEVSYVSAFGLNILTIQL